MFLQVPAVPAAASQVAPLSNRRSALGRLGLTGLALVASSSPVAAALAKVNKTAEKSVAASGLPLEWLSLQDGQVLFDYTRYLVALKLRHITPQQVIAAHAKSHGTIWNTLPPKAWWNRMGYTLRVVDRIALYLGMPVQEIVSAYRCPAYNAHCPGAKSGSWHQANVAVDVVFPTQPSAVTAMSRNVRDRGLFKGGIGAYPTFTHIDTRGENINW
ncbi:MAG: D-Ala-D-Ala carboxypeptidase family metallohydrolase [Verrucomicrobia bacterium]|nr:D-Ala-D-Ala carboxypeptidase family metallohydrolase [Verrucomicrobiota bacterium]